MARSYLSFCAVRASPTKCAKWRTFYSARRLRSLCRWRWAALLLARLRLTFHRGEAALIEFVAGAGCLSFLIAILCALHIARKGVFQWGGLAVISLALWQARGAPRRKSLPAIPLKWMAAFFLIFSAFFIYYFFNALAPEISPDGTGYHLGNVVAHVAQSRLRLGLPQHVRLLLPGDGDAVPGGLRVRPPPRRRPGALHLALHAAAADGLLGTALRLSQSWPVCARFSSLPVR